MAGWAVDIVPFGAVAPRQYLEDDGVILDVTGMSDADASSVKITVEDGLDIRCVSLAGLMVLKLVAWRIRHPTTSKDGQDIAVLLDASHSGVFESECWSDETALRQTDYDIYRAGPYRMGAQIRAEFAYDTVDQLLELLSGEQLDRLLVDVPRGAVDRREQLELS